MLYSVHKKKSVVYFICMLLSNRLTKLCWVLLCHTDVASVLV